MHENTKIIIGLVIVIFFVAGFCFLTGDYPSLVHKIKSSQAHSYIGQKVIIEVIPTKRVSLYSSYSIYKTKEGIKLVIKKPAKLDLNKKQEFFGEIKKDYKYQGKYTLFVKKY